MCWKVSVVVRPLLTGITHSSTLVTDCKQLGPSCTANNSPPLVKHDGPYRAHNNPPTDHAVGTMWVLQSKSLTRKVVYSLYSTLRKLPRKDVTNIIQMSYRRPTGGSYASIWHNESHDCRMKKISIAI